MAKYLLAYYGKPDLKTKEDGQNHMQAWRAWSDGLGEAVVDPGLPVGPAKVVGQQGVREASPDNPLSGVTILQAETMEAAIEMARACPHIDAGGTIAVAEAMNMEM